MTRPVPQQAVDAAMEALWCEHVNRENRTPAPRWWTGCAEHMQTWTDQGCPVAVKVAAAVVAAVQGPLQAQALREACDPLEEFGGSDLPTWVLSWLLNRAARIEAGDQ